MFWIAKNLILLWCSTPIRDPKEIRLDIVLACRMEQFLEGNVSLRAKAISSVSKSPIMYFELSIFMFDLYRNISVNVLTEELH